MLMNKITKALLVAALSSLPLLAASPQTTVRMTAPFAFAAGDVVLPAGQYDVTTDAHTGVLSLRSTDGKLTRSLGAIPIDTYAKDVAPRLEFRKMGSMMSLEKVWMHDGSVELPAPSREAMQAPALADSDD